MAARPSPLVPVALAVVILAVGPAAACARLYEIPGVAGRGVAVAQAARLADGGAIVAGAVRRRFVAGGRVGTRLAVIRLTAAGEVDRRYGGGDGVDLLQLDHHRAAATRATAVAVDPRSGAAWVGAAVGRHGAGAVVALDGAGGLVRRFGGDGVVGLRGAPAPTALAVGPRRVLVAAGSSPCRGCRLLALARSTGRRHGAAVAAPVDGGAAARCPRAGVSSLALSGARLLLGGAGGGCRLRLVATGAALGGAGGRALALGAGASGTALAPAAGALGACVGVERARTVGLVRIDPARLPAGSRAPHPPAADLPEVRAARGGRSLVAVAPVGDRGCAALLRGRRGARVVQVVRGSRRARVSRLPGGFTPAALFFCRRHVQVIGVRRGRAVIAVVAARTK